ncbi:hypothetical protein YT1_5483 [Rhodococcus ruber]|nr:hypothetical protein YT1_5483 [Rhodococcus ruber]
MTDGPSLWGGEGLRGLRLARLMALSAIDDDFLSQNTTNRAADEFPPAAPTRSQRPGRNPTPGADTTPERSAVLGCPGTRPHPEEPR